MLVPFNRLLHEGETQTYVHPLSHVLSPFSPFDEVMPKAVIYPYPMGMGIKEAQMIPSTQKDAMKRLAYIEGHLSGVRKMLEEERYCVDILKQTHAIRKAIEKFEALLLDSHLRTCVVDGIQKGKAEHIIQELRSLYTVGR